MKYADVKPGARVYNRNLGLFGVVVARDPEDWTPQTVTVATARYPWPVSWVVDRLMPARPVAQA